MALRPDRSREGLDHIDFFCNDTTALRGGIAVISTGASGVALDNSSAVVTYAADPSGKMALGVLMQDVVNYDLTTRDSNVHKQEVQTGGKVTVRDNCVVTTDRIFPGNTPTVGALAYVTQSGYITSTLAAEGVTKTPQVGRFLSTKDEDGFAKVHINCVN
jgi:hypothetical protein